MSFNSKAFRALVSLSLMIGISSMAFADTIRLKDGSRVKGKIVSFSAGRFTVAVGEGTRRRQMTFSVGEIESIDFDAPTTYTASRSTPQQDLPTVKVADKKPAQQTVPPPVIEEEEEEPVVSVPVEETPPASTKTTAVQKTGPAQKPVELNVKVLADNTANGWTNSGWVVRKGQKIRISGSGEVSIGGGKKTGPSGLYDVEDKDKLLKSVPTGALIAVIGDDNNDFIYIGTEREFTAARDGALFLGLNEGNLSDNTGSFQVRVEISPEGGE